jgi:hypothetical protein
MQKYLIAFTLAMTTAASAASIFPEDMDPFSPQLNITTPGLKPPPRSMSRNLQIFNRKTGEIYGIGTVNGNHLFLRNTKDEFVGTIIFNSDKTKTLYDPKGNVVDTLSFPVPDKQP